MGTKQRSTTVKDPSSEGMLPRTRRGVPDEKKKMQKFKKRRRKLLTPADLVRDGRLLGSWPFWSVKLTVKRFNLYVRIGWG